MLEFRLGWNFESFHAFLAATLAHEVTLASALVEQTTKEKPESIVSKHTTEVTNWGAHVRLRLLGLTRLEHILRQVQETRAGRDAALVAPRALEQVAWLKARLEKCLT